MFVIILSYIQPLSVVDAHVVEHRAFLDTLYAKGLLIASGRQTPATGGVLLAHGASRAELEAILAQDPFCTAKVATYTFYEFTPNKYAPGFASFIPSATGA